MRGRIELDGPEARAYLAAREGCAAQDLRITALGGGVSNHVLLVEGPARRYIVKQSLAKLRVQEDWFSRRDRIWRESEAIQFLADVLPEGAVPRVLYEDRENYLFAMTAARGERTWKEVLIAGEATEEQAEFIGRMHKALLQASAGSARLREAFAGLEVFDQLRLDPYYRFTATRHPEMARLFEAAIARCNTERTGLVHGDWSPKNLMVDGNHVTAIDFEVIHYGDPAFDCAFLLNHLLLKSFFRPQFAALYRRCAEKYWRTLEAGKRVEAGTVAHLPLLMMARMDGKSPVEYIRDESLRERIRCFARRLAECEPAGVEDVLGLAYAELAADIQ
ncbi:MAG: phosphotransferase [Bryobacterales bacterium]|nr:phosphotransferase [Bryobacterales bacterium]